MGNENFPGLTGNFEVRAGRIRYFEVNHVVWQIISARFGFQIDI
jgi:hypothetical protein